MLLGPLKTDLSLGSSRHKTIRSAQNPGSGQLESVVGAARMGLQPGVPRAEAWSKRQALACNVIFVREALLQEALPRCGCLFLVRVPFAGLLYTRTKRILPSEASP